MKPRLQVAILAMALLVAGASSAFANVPTPGAGPVATAPSTTAADLCAAEPAPEPAAAPARPGETIIPLEMLCPPPRPGPRYYASNV